MALKLSVTAEESSGVTITGIQAQVIRRSPLESSVLADNPGQGGTIVTNTMIGLNLDEPNAQAASFKDSELGPTAQSLGGTYFSKYSIDVPDKATHVFEVVAYAQRADEEWDLKINYVASGKNGSVTVTDGRHPFRLAGFSGHTRFAAMYFPGYIADPPSKNAWTDVGKQLCPVYYRPC